MMDKQEFRKYLYTFARTQNEFAKMFGYSLSTIRQVLSGQFSAPKKLIIAMRLQYKINQYEYELKIFKEYYGYPQDMDFKQFLQKLGKHKKRVLEKVKNDKTK